MARQLTRRDVVAGIAAAACTPALAGTSRQPIPPDFSNLAPDRRAEAEAIFARMMAALPYDREIVSGANAVAEWNRLRALGKTRPIVVGDDDALERIAEQFSIDDPAVFGTLPGLVPPRPPRAILEAAVTIEVPRDLRLWPGAYGPDDLSAKVGTWPAGSTGQAIEPFLSVAFDPNTGEMFDQVHVLHIPAEHSWQVPAYLRWGDWNACPPAEYHVAALRRWNASYGAELAGINGDSMDVWVARPPADQAEALAVAKDLYLYCPDLVDQGTGTIAALAAGMVTSHWWNFWWD